MCDYIQLLLESPCQCCVCVCAS